MGKALEGVRVLENTIAVAGPTCGMSLAQFGAEVIRIESSKAQTWGTRAGKKSVALNLRTEKGKEVFKELAKKSDVILENYAPGAMERLGLDYDAIREVNPKIIYASLTGYGHTGPHNRRPGFDFTVLGRSGLAYLNARYGLDREPTTCQNVALSDRIGSLQTVVCVLSALYYREKTGKGQYIDVSMLDSMIRNLLDDYVNMVLLQGKWDNPYGDRLHIPGYQPVKCKDGYIMLGMLGIRIWQRFCKLVEREDVYEILLKEGGDTWMVMMKRPDLADEAEKIINEWFSTKTRKEAVETLQKAGIPADPIQSLEEVIKDPQLRARNMFVKAYNPEAKKEVEIVGTPIKMSETPGIVERPFPSLGEDTEEVLSTLLGYSKEEIAKLKEDEITV